MKRKPGRPPGSTNKSRKEINNKEVTKLVSTDIGNVDLNNAMEEIKKHGILSVEGIAHFLILGYSIPKIATKFNVCNQAVYQYVNRHKEELVDLLDYDTLHSLRIKNVSGKLVKQIDSVLDKEKSVKDLAIAHTNLTKDQRLISGESTDNVSVKIAENEMGELQALADLIADKAIQGIVNERKNKAKPEVLEGTIVEDSHG